MRSKARAFFGVVALSCALPALGAGWIARWPIQPDYWQNIGIQMAVDGSRAIYVLSVTDRTANLDKWLPSGKRAWSQVVSSNAGYLANIAIETNGSVWVAASSRLLQFSPEGVLQRRFSSIRARVTSPFPRTEFMSRPTVD